MVVVVVVEVVVVVVEMIRVIRVMKFTVETGGGGKVSVSVPPQCYRSST